MEILLVEDDENFRESLESCLQVEGFSVHGVGDGQQAIDYLREKKVDLVITDMRMPKKNGLELLREIKAKNAEYPVVMILTGFSNHDAAALKREGASAVLNKPVNLKNLLDQIRAIATDSPGSQ